MLSFEGTLSEAFITLVGRSAAKKEKKWILLIEFSRY